MTLTEYLQTTTASALAERAGVAHTTVIRIAKGEVMASPETAKAIEKATDGVVTAVDVLAAVLAGPGRKSRKNQRAA